MPSHSASAKQSAGRFRLDCFGLFLICAVCVTIQSVVRADEPTSQPADKTYSIDYFAPIFEARQGQPTADPAFQARLAQIFGNTPVELGQTPTGYIAPGPNVPLAHRRISELNIQGAIDYSQGAILAIDKGIVAELNRNGYGAVLAVPSPNDIDPQDLSDLREHLKGTMHILISVPTAGQVRTVASGDRIGPNEPRVDNPKHKRILHNSPIQATATTQSSGESNGSSTFFNQQVVNDYVDRLNRQPGRRVDVALSAADQPDQYTMDYLVNENKPWYVYAQGSNTGTQITGVWREQFGFVDNELTGNDDILNVNAITDFNHSTNVVGSYEFPIGSNDPNLGTDRLRARVYGLWDEYTAADLGVASDTFNGNDYSGGAEIAYNVFQFHNMFLDLVGGARYQESQVKSTLEGTNVNAGYVLPYAGARVQDYEPTFNYVGAVNLEGGITSTSQSELAEIGRANPDADFALLQPTVQGSFYLDPLVDHADYAAGRGMLANEVYLSFRGQYSFNYRLIPQYQMAAGGYYTVRGYPEAVTAGDTVLLGTAEYRLHIARLLGVSPNPTTVNIFGDPFRVLPQFPYQRPDWDFIVRGFIDGGEVLQSRRIPGEFDDTLVGAGIGAELQIRQNIDIRADWGWALYALSNRVTPGSSQVNVIITLLY
jgi:hemolysin activation/secretion protein